MPMSPEQHSEHMSKVTEGLNAILQSQDIDEVHTIAQSLLSEEQGEQAAEAPAEAQGGNLRAMLGDAIAKGNTQ